jgi:signal transduction histidine kinase
VSATLGFRTLGVDSGLDSFIFSRERGDIRVASPLRAHDLTYGDDTASSDEIRRLLARELHDRVAQTLTTMLIELENFKVEQTGRQSVLRQVDELQESARGVLSNLRHVLYDLRGQTGREEGFADTVRTLLVRFQERTQVKAILSVSPSWPANMRSPAALNILRIIEEALNNVRIHSGAKSVDSSRSRSRTTAGARIRTAAAASSASVFSECASGRSF